VDTPTCHGGHRGGRMVVVNGYSTTHLLFNLLELLAEFRLTSGVELS
jgi:hypothetical protein